MTKKNWIFCVIPKSQLWKVFFQVRHTLLSRHRSTNCERWMFYILHFSKITVISEGPNPKAHVMGMNSASWKATFPSALVLAKQQLPRALLELKKRAGSIKLYNPMSSQNTQKVWLQGAALASQLQTMESRGDDCHRGRNSYSQPHLRDFSAK